MKKIKKHKRHPLQQQKEMRLAKKQQEVKVYPIQSKLEKISKWHRLQRVLDRYFKNRI